MRPRRALTGLLVGLLAGGSIAAAVTPALAHPRAARTTLTARLSPPVVTVGEPAAITSRLTPAQDGRPVTVQTWSGGAWTRLDTATSSAAGRALLSLDTSTTGTTKLRVVAPAWHGKPWVASASVTLTVRASTACKPAVALVDTQATPEARCLAARLDRWHSAGLMAVGQELNMSTQSYAAPLTALGASMGTPGTRRVSVVGFDLWELGKTKTYEYPFFDQAFADLVTAAQNGAVLTASWHTPNPKTGGEYNDRSWHQLSGVLDEQSEAGQTFWAAYDEQLTVLKAFQDAGVAVVFRPLHEANGDWFWWGRSSATTYKAVWRRMQQKAWAAGVHNVVWAYSFAAADRTGITAPERLLPSKVDVAGIDTYWQTAGKHSSQVPSMDGYAAVAKKVRRMAVTEIGPYADTKKVWRASTVTATARTQGRKPIWSMLWVDDAAGVKQISSLRGGRSWLDSCPFGYCSVG